MSGDDFRPARYRPGDKARAKAAAVRPAPRGYAVMFHPTYSEGAGGVYGPVPDLQACLDYAPDELPSGSPGTYHIWQLGGGAPDCVLYDWKGDHWRYCYRTCGEAQ